MVNQPSFLELLVAGAPATRYEELLRTATTQAQTDEEHQALLEEHRLALQIRDTLEIQRARQEGQRALLDCAKELADVPDNVDTILTSIVTRAQRLLDCDLAYLSLNAADKPETYVRVMVGATSSYWKDIRIPFGSGVGGQVAATAAPFATADYFNDERLSHTGPVDQSAHAERQAAILGVPLIYRGHVIGVLYASNRTPGAFSHENIALLSSFAALAAIAIEQATLLEDKERALIELHHINATLQSRSQDTARAVAAHDRSMDIILRGGGVQEVVTATSESLAGSLAIFNQDGTPLAWTSNTAEADLKAMLAAAHAVPTHTGRSVQHDRFWVIGLVAGTENLGTLVWGADQPTALADPDRRLLERAAVVAALLQLFSRNLGAAETQVRGELLDDLLSPNPGSSASIAERAQRVGYQLRKPHTILAIHIDPDHRSRLATAAADTAAARSGLSTTRDGLAVLVLPAESPSATARQVSRSLSLRLGTPVTAGAAGPITDPDGLRGAFDEARACVQALLRLDRPGSSATAADLGYAGLLIGHSSSTNDFVTRTLGPIIRHDEHRSSALVTTLDTYFNTGQSLAASAKILHLHANTITQRLDRVKKLLQVDWASHPEQALELQLALHLHRIFTIDAAD